ncbi:MFS transporter [Flexivirga alba]|uniref:MFS transporter n=1 Tax=Flexivirga alba TaxID=702742 RepID=A0ABW2AJU5_9MICO
MTGDSINDRYGSTDPLGAWQLLSRGAKGLLVARMVNRLGGFSMAFLAVLLTEELHESVQTAGFIVAVFGLATIPSRLAGGWLLDAIGPRPTILLGLIGCAITQLGLAAAHSGTIAVIAAVGLGLSYELIEPPTQAMIAAESNDDNGPALFGLLFVSMTIAAVGAGGVAAIVAGWDLRMLFVIDAVSCLMCAVVIRAYLPDREARHTTKTAARPWRDRRFLGVFGMSTVFTLVYMVVIFGMPLTVTDRRLGLWVIGVNTALSAVVAVLAQPLLRVDVLNRGGGHVAIAVGFVGLALSISCIAVAHSAVLILLSGVVGAAADVLLMSHFYAQVSRLAPEGAAGRYLAMFGISWGIATSVAPLIIGAALTFGDGVPLWLGTAVVALALAAVAPPMSRRVNAPRHTSALAVVGD